MSPMSVQIERNLKKMLKSEKMENYGHIARYNELALAFHQGTLNTSQLIELVEVAKYCKMEAFTSWSQVQEADEILALIEFSGVLAQ